VSFAGVDGSDLVIGISDIAVSSGSACSSSSEAPSHVLQAIAAGAGGAAASIRFGLGRFTTEDDIDYAIEKFSTVVQHLKAQAPAPAQAPTHTPAR
jgi:cysteine desulfurase